MEARTPETTVSSREISDVGSSILERRPQESAGELTSLEKAFPRVLVDILENLPRDGLIQEGRSVFGPPNEL